MDTMKRSRCHKFIVSVLLILFISPSALVSDTSYAAAGKKHSQEAKKQKNPIIAVFTLEEGPGVTRGSGEIAADKLINELVNNGIRVVERDRLSAVLKEQSLSTTGAVAGADAGRIGKLASATLVITGRITKTSAGTEISTRLVDAESGIILSSDITVLQSAMGTELRPARVDTTGTQRNIPSSKNRFIAAENEAKAELRDVKLFRSGGALYIIGLTFNPGTIAIKQPVISVILKNGDGAQIAVLQCFSPRRVEPGETVPFSGIRIGAPAYHSYDIEYTPEPEDFFTHRISFSSSGEIFAAKKGFSGGWDLSGTVMNQNDTPVRLTQIIVMLFDAKGTYIGFANGFMTAKRLAPGKSSPYSVLILPYNLAGKPASYRLLFSALEDR
jgi:TolB-like protein